MTDYNKTQLNPNTTFERHVFHRDQFSHYLRWTHVLKRAKIGMNVLDFGCGSGNLAEVFYRNKYAPGFYLGLDVRPQTIKKCEEKFKMCSWAHFFTSDLCSKDFKLSTDVSWDIVCCFELLEHVGKNNAVQILENIKNHLNDDTVFLLSTPCYDAQVGAADNHMIDGEVGEFTYEELKKTLGDLNFTIVNHWGTFASQKDYKPFMNDWQQKYYEKAHEYFDSNILSNLMAPLFPEHSRNCLWELKK